MIEFGPAVVLEASRRCSSDWRLELAVDCVDWQAVKTERASKQVAILVIMFLALFAGAETVLCRHSYNYYTLFQTGKHDLCYLHSATQNCEIESLALYAGGSITSAHRASYKLRR